MAHIGIANIIGKRGGFDWDAYWVQRSDVLFFSETSKITGGRLYNQVSGSSDYITVAGATGSETYTTPATVDYIATDTEWLWIDTSENAYAQTTAVLISKDFARSFIKYDNTTPNTIRAIMIMKSTFTVDSTFKDRVSKDFQLHPFYFNEYNANGFIKDNRTNYDPYTYILPALNDGDSKFYLDYLTNVTYDGSNRVASWADALGGAVAPVQATDDKKPVIDLDGSLDADGILDDGILGDGANDALKAVTFTWNQPEFVYVVAKFLTWTSGDILFDGNGSHSGKLFQVGVTPNVQAAAGAASGNLVPVLNRWYIFRVYFNGASSKAIMNNGTPVTGNFGASNMSGLALFSKGGTADNWSNAKMKAIIGRVSAVSETDIYNFLNKKYGLGLAVI